MLFSAASILSLLVASVAAQTSGFDAITKPTQDQSVAAGSTLNIVWEDSVGSVPITITLLYGASQSTLQVGDAIATSISSSLGTYAWTVPSSIVGYATYGFKLTLDSDPSTFQYSFPFKITGSASTSVGLTGTPSSVVNVQAVATTASPSSGTTTIVVASNTASPTVTPTASPSAVTPSASIKSSITSAIAIVSTAPVASTVPTPSSGSNSSASNFTRTFTTSSATLGSSSGVSASSSTTLPSSGAFQDVAVKFGSVMGALAFSLALVM